MNKYILEIKKGICTYTLYIEPEDFIRIYCLSQSENALMSLGCGLKAPI
jgi:hypothetical protein